MLATTRRSLAAAWATFLIGLAAAALAPAGAPAAVTVSQSGWAWGNPTPQGNTLRTVDFLGATGYAIGDSGTALRTTDGGATWSGLPTGTSGQLTRLQIIDPAALVVLGGDGCILRRSTDAGRTFSRMFEVAESNCPDRVQAFSFVDRLTGFLLLRDGSVLATHDGGDTFSRQTAIPGTAASTSAGQSVPADLHFGSATSGIVFVNPKGAGSSAAYATTDGGVSWTPLSSVDAGTVTGLYFLDSHNGYATGPNTLLRTTDSGVTWKASPIGPGHNLTSIRCSDPMTCVLTVAAGDRLLRTADGGATASVTTPSSTAIFGVAYANPSQVVAVGSGGVTVVSADGGKNFSAVGADIGGQYLRLRSGPGGLVYGPGAKGQLARSDDGGMTWRTLSTQTSSDLIDAAFASRSTGYALDVNGGLQVTVNGGASWKTLDPGTSAPARAVATIGSDVVLLAGPVGIRRAQGGGRFDAVPGRAVARAQLDDLQVLGNTAVSWGSSSPSLLVSVNKGVSWTAVALPLTDRRGHTRERVQKASFVSARVGFMLDSNGRTWFTADRGRHWSERFTGSSDGLAIAFADRSNGFEALGAFGNRGAAAYVLRTSDGGRTWRPQLISPGQLHAGGVVVASPSDAFALVDQTPPGGAQLDRSLFFTHSGGDAGAAGTLRISTPHVSFSHRTLHRIGGAVAVDGVLAGAQGGERIVVSRRDASGGPWVHQTVTAGANGGSFTTNWTVHGSSVFVAQWAGDSGRASLGSEALTVRVR